MGSGEGALEAVEFHKHLMRVYTATWLHLRAIMLSEVNAASRKRTRTVGFASVTLFKARPQQNDGEQNHCARGLQVGRGCDRRESTGSFLRGWNCSPS